ncbi:hypothetical protein E2C01_003054 [Portunus trituberculatus]|uniref:Uncharacterized protein n=1 Tax=Portunus trituberculatus TaxID=210409 RepID=A0A5B7CLX0_PORTR|nr:hypothetical protein [Portunus trituberculatus]
MGTTRTTGTMRTWPPRGPWGKTSRAHTKPCRLKEPMGGCTPDHGTPGQHFESWRCYGDSSDKTLRMARGKNLTVLGPHHEGVTKAFNVRQASCYVQHGSCDTICVCPFTVSDSDTCTYLLVMVCCIMEAKVTSQSS